MRENRNFNMAQYYAIDQTRPLRGKLEIRLSRWQWGSMTGNPAVIPNWQCQ